MKLPECPKGHTLPNIVDGVGCAMDFCAEDNVPLKSDSRQYEQHKQARAKNLALGNLKKGVETNGHGKKIDKAAVQIAKKEAMQHSDDLLSTLLEGSPEKATAKSVMVQTRVTEIANTAKAIGRQAAHRAFMGTPAKFETPEDSRAYVEKRLDDFLPDAVDRLGFELLYGDPEEQRKASREVLDRKGFGKRETHAQQGAPIVIVNVNGADGQKYTPPFLARVEKKEDK